MFDGLRDKLDEFREDADEAVEEAEDSEDSSEEAVEADVQSESADDVDAEAAEEAAEDAAGEPEPDEASGSGFAGKARSLVGDRAFVIDEESLDGLLEELEIALLSSDVEVEVTREIKDRVRDSLVGEKKHWRESKEDLVVDALHDALVDVLEVDGFDFDSYVQDAEKPVVVVFTGVNGVGKTTSIAKIAERLENQGLSSVMANGDTYRAGANQQIQEHAEALDKKVIVREQGSDPTSVIYDAVEHAEANDVDVVLGDTAGRLHTSDDLMKQLEKIERVVEPDLTLFVDEAVAGQDAVERAREFDSAAEIDGVVLTKADADAQGGAAISISHVTGKPIVFLGTGQGYSDLEEFDAEELVDRLLERGG